MQRGIRIELAVEVVVMQPVNHAVGAHRQPLHGGAGASHQVVDSPIFEQQVVGSVVRDDEQRMLPRADHQHARNQHQRIWPKEYCRAKRSGNHGNVFENCCSGAPGGAARQLLNDLFG